MAPTKVKPAAAKKAMRNTVTLPARPGAAGWSADDRRQGGDAEGGRQLTLRVVERGRASGVPRGDLRENTPAFIEITT